MSEKKKKKKKKKSKYDEREGQITLGSGEEGYARLDKKKLTVYESDDADADSIKVVFLSGCTVRCLMAAGLWHRPRRTHVWLCAVPRSSKTTIKSS